MEDRNAVQQLIEWMEDHNSLDETFVFQRLQADLEMDDLIYFDVEHERDFTRLHRLSATDAALRIAWSRSIPLPGFQPVLDQLFHYVSPARIADSLLALVAHHLALPGPSQAGSAAFIVPLVSRGRRRAFFWFRSKMIAEARARERNGLLRDIHTLASLFHARMLEREDNRTQARPPKRPLTKRELEVLGWIAAGKSYWEIGQILSISERTVRHFMANARAKLDVVTNNQAVAEAAWSGLIQNRHDKI